MHIVRKVSIKNLNQQLAIYFFIPSKPWFLNHPKLRHSWVIKLIFLL